MVNVAFTGGGTGGHIYPGLAVAEALQGSLKTRLAGLECRVFWIGSNKGMDRAIVEGAGLEFLGIPVGRLRRYFTLKTIPDTFRVAAGFFAARRILKKRKVQVLFSKGGFVSVPPCAAAASLGIPVLTHESDFSPGLATRLNLRFVRKTNGKVFTAYEDTVRFLSGLPKDRVIVSGNPVRSVFRAADPAKGRAFLGLGAGERILLVLGGSQGAREVNGLVRASLENLCRHYTVVHQYGPGQSDIGQPIPGKYLPFPYIGEEMPHILAAAELVLGRSGAGTVWESATLGKPMILIPLSGSGTRGDQVENARFFERRGAALVLTGDDPSTRTTPENLSRVVADLAGDTQLRERMADAARQVGSLDGAAIIGDSISEMIRCMSGKAAKNADNKKR
ncbi:MAG: undecaprenyldiphospho-muramoylpentapeptide beta-N-acetylglucosaminyltransferase [Treponema sp.]|nr:undecaprenyldiphospho-muramoylpentapeptide beta-N-acetylglucosaminyltransferase [Treponema sp.]